MIEIRNILEVEKHIDGLDTVIFDLDDTLYPEKDYVRSGFKAVAMQFPEISGMYEELWEAFERKKPAIDVVLAAHELAAEKEKAVQIYRTHKPDIFLYDGVGPMLERIRHRVKTTDGRPGGQRAKLKALHLSDAVDEIIVTDELGGVEFRKPNDAAFRLMSKKLGSALNRMCYVGDNIGKDFVSPEKLGMRCIWWKNTQGIYADKY